MRRNSDNALKREIVHIDEEKCDGCGVCVPSCAEGAIRIVDGKTKLIADRLCDGLGACLGHCPRGAITVEERESEPYDEEAVAAHLSQQDEPPAAVSGCPSARAFSMGASASAPAAPSAGAPRDASALQHWPIQLHLLPPTAPFIKGADLLLCAPCVPVAAPDFQERLLAGRAVALACPKLDNQTGYVEKLATMFSEGGLNSLTVARMSVPCCGGLLRLAHQARELAGAGTPIKDMVISHDGSITETDTDTSPTVEVGCANRNH